MRGTTVVKLFVGLTAAVFLIHQSISAFYRPIKTESAVYDTVTDGIKVTGTILRTETPIHADAGHVLHFIVGDGNRVAKNGVIANLYDSEDASVKLSQIDELKSRIADLEDLLSYNNLEAADLGLINQRVSDHLNAFIVNSAGRNFDECDGYGSALLSAINRRQAAMGQAVDFSAQLASLNAQLTSLSASLPTAKGSITAEQSGYFVSVTDGYEQALSCEDLSRITPEYIDSVKPAEMPAGTVGKIVSDYEWYIAAKVGINESLQYKEGDRLRVYTTVKSSPVIEAAVKSINLSESSSEAVLLLACSEMNSELASVRSGPMTLVRKEYSGLRVPKSALRVVDSVKGVYVVSGMMIKFVSVNMLYSDDTYMICEQQQSDETVLRLYDQVVVKGRGLYDGKIVG